MRVGAVLAAALAAAALAAPVAAAAPPALTVEATGAGYERVLTVQLQARKAKVRAATVAASAAMNAPGHFMAVGPVRLARAGASVMTRSTSS